MFRVIKEFVDERPVQTQLWFHKGADRNHTQRCWLRTIFRTKVIDFDGKWTTTPSREIAWTTHSLRQVLAVWGAKFRATAHGGNTDHDESSVHADPGGSLLTTDEMRIGWRTGTALQMMHGGMRAGQVIRAKKERSEWVEDGWLKSAVSSNRNLQETSAS